MKRGEVRLYKFNHPDKSRPVVILTRDSVIGYLGEVTVAPVTTTIRDVPSEVVLSKSDGVPRDCAVNCDHLQTVSKTKLGSLLTTLSAGRMDQVHAAIDFALGLQG